MHVFYVCKHIIACVWRSEDNLWESVLRLWAPETELQWSVWGRGPLLIEPSHRPSMEGTESVAAAVSPEVFFHSVIFLLLKIHNYPKKEEKSP